MKKHNSHHIFIYLGLLALLFVVIFGLRYFQGEYKFSDVVIENRSSSYDEGINTINPFVKTASADLTLNRDWVTVGFNDIMFMHPRKYQAKLAGESQMRIAPFYKKGKNCDLIKDEQERSLCVNPPISPDIIIDTNAELENPFNQESVSVIIDGIEWKRVSLATEFGGSVWFSRPMEGQVVEVLYRHVDASGGVIFKDLQQEYGNQYQLSQSEQESLVRDIISTIKLNK